MDLRARPVSRRSRVSLAATARGQRILPEMNNFDG
jgi:hypothetical protein